MQFCPIHRVLQKSFSQLPLPTTSPFFTGFIFCHIKHKLFTLLLIAYHFYSPFTYEVNFCLLSIKDASSTTYLYLLKDVGLGSAVFLGFFFNKRNMLPLHLQKTDNDQAIGMLGCRTDTPTHIDLSH